MTDRKAKYGPWQGLDFDPTEDFTRTARLCPEGWVELFWDDGALLPIRVYDVSIDEAELIGRELLDNPFGPLDFGLEEWPHGRLFIGRLEREVDDLREMGGRIVYGFAVRALEVDGQPVYADPLPEPVESVGEPQIESFAVQTGTVAAPEVLAVAGLPARGVIGIADFGHGPIDIIGADPETCPICGSNMLEDGYCLACEDLNREGGEEL